MNGSSQPLPRNPVTNRHHQYQVLTQITLPMIIGVLILLGCGALIVTSGLDRVVAWAHVSTIFMALIMMVIGITGFLLIGGVIYLLAKLIQILPGYAYIAQVTVEYYGKMIQRAAVKITQPAVVAGGLWEGLKTIIRRSIR